jgi:hypothetical protein
MPKWDWLEKSTNSATWGFFLRVIVKASGLFIILNLVFALVTPMEALGRVSLYNTVLLGRERLPYGENPALSYNLSLFNLPAMFASHEVNRDKAGDEFRVLFIGDSATWGFLLENDDTLAGQINAGGYRLDDGRRVMAYNLGYPSMTVTKDLLLIDYAMRYDPDMIVWPVTLRSFPHSTQLAEPKQDTSLVLSNAGRVDALIERYNLALDGDDPRFVRANFWQNTIVGQRRELADCLRLQAYAVSWAATGIDQHIPDEITLRTNDFDDDTSYLDFSAETPFTIDDLAVDVLAAGIERAGQVPVLIVNEPMFIGDGEYSDLHYNSFYPRWAYDLYREMLIEQAEANGWQLLDLWDSLAPEVFTDTPVHVTPEGSAQVAERIIAAILDNDPTG